MRLAPSLGKGVERGFVRLEGIDRGLPRQGKGERAESGEEIGNAARIANALPHQLRHVGFSFNRGLQECARGEFDRDAR